MSNLQNEADKVVVNAEQIKQIDKLVIDIKREYGSFRAFSSKRVMPIVTYTASVDGRNAIEACTDLSLLRPSVVKDLQAALSEHHNSLLLSLISELSYLLNDLYESLSETEKAEHFSDHPDYGDLKPNIPATTPEDFQDES